MFLSFLKKHESGLVLLSFIGIFSAVALRRGMAIDWDLLDYHFYNGFALLHGRHFYDLAPAMVQNFLHPFFDVINYLLLISLPAGWVVVVNATITAVSAFFVYRLACLLLPAGNSVTLRLYALTAVWIAMTGVANSSTLAFMTNDSKMGLMAMVSLCALVKGLLEEEAVKKRNYCLFSGIVIGLATAFKLVAGIYAVGFGVALLLCRRPSLDQLRLCFAYGAAALVSFALACGPWMYFLWTSFGNPLFPYYNDFFHSPYIETLRFNDPAFYPINLWLSPIDWAFKFGVYARDHLREPRFFGLCCLAVAGLGALLVRKQVFGKEMRPCWWGSGARAAVWRFLIVALIVSYTVWYETFTIHRYLVTVEMMLGIFCVALVLGIFSHFAVRVAALAVLIVIFNNTTHLIGLGLVPFSSIRAAFTQDTFVVSRVPEVPEDSVILIDAPAAYLIPQFPEKVRFIGTTFVFGRFHDPAQSTIYAERATRLMNSTEALFILAGSKQLENSQSDSEKPFMLWFLDTYGYEIKGACQEFVSNVSTDGIMRLCQITKKQP